MLWKKLLEFSFPSFWFNDRNIDFLIFIIIKLVTESLNNKIGIPYFLPPSYPFSLHFSQSIELSSCFYFYFLLCEIKILLSDKGEIQIQILFLVK